MAAVLTETREQEAPWLSKVDDRGQTHVYRKTTAGDLKVGDHILEHIVGHKRQVATPVLAVEKRPEGVIVTIPDRHADNSPVQELYPFNQPVFISRTPHLEQYNPADNIFVQADKKEPDMEQKTLEQERRDIQSARGKINAGVENMIMTQDVTRAREAAQVIRKGCGDLSDAIILGSDAIAEQRIKDAFEFARWNRALTESAKFTGGRSDRLDGYAQAVENQELREHAAYARGALDTATQVALEQRKRGILISLNGPLAEYALQDGWLNGVVQRPEKEESGVMLAKVSQHAVLQREDGTLVAVPVPDHQILRRIEIGKPVNLFAAESGVYVRKAVMEKQTEVKKQEYPRMEAHLKDPDNTWHSVSLYVDKEGQSRGVISVENKEAGIAEKHSVQFAEKVSEKTGEKFLSTKVAREDGTTLYANLTPHEKNGERWLSASFAERDPSKEKGQQLTPITGTGGTLKPNAALLEKAEKDRTAQYVRETFKVDPAKEVGKSKGVSR